MMDYLDAVFCFIMSGVLLDVGHPCSGARTFVECQGMAWLACLFDRRFDWRIFAFAAAAALLANMMRCALLLWWISRSLPHFSFMHDYAGAAIVLLAFVAIALFKPGRRK